MKYDGAAYCAVIWKAATRTENLTIMDKLNCHAACITEGHAEEHFTVLSYPICKKCWHRKIHVPVAKILVTVKVHSLKSVPLRS